jgi:hypothetical protein
MEPGARPSNALPGAGTRDGSLSPHSLPTSGSEPDLVETGPSTPGGQLTPLSLSLHASEPALSEREIGFRIARPSNS